MSDCKIWVCPICKDQLWVDDDYEMGNGKAECFKHEAEYGAVEGVEIRVEPIWEDLEDRREQVDAKLAEQKAAKEERERKRAEWEALPQEEKDRREAERRSKLSPMALAMEDACRRMAEDTIRQMNRPSLLDFIKPSTEPERSG